MFSWETFISVFYQLIYSWSSLFNPQRPRVKPPGWTSTTSPGPGTEWRLSHVTSQSWKLRSPTPDAVTTIFLSFTFKNKTFYRKLCHDAVSWTCRSSSPAAPETRCSLFSQTETLQLVSQVQFFWKWHEHRVTASCEVRWRFRTMSGFTSISPGLLAH